MSDWEPDLKAPADSRWRPIYRKEWGSVIGENRSINKLIKEIFPEGEKG